MAKISKKKRAPIKSKKASPVRKSAAKPKAKPKAKTKSKPKAKKIGGKPLARPMHKASPKKAPKLSHVKSVLLQEMARLKKRLGVIQSDDSTVDNSDVGDIADVATNHETREILRELQSTEEEQLKQVEAALIRIDQGSYGLCERCGAAIEPARLDALPHALTCISCRRKEERGEFAARV